ncbi:MAG TPA: 30S ribosomal protein S8 [Gammaproteobacteria bacterium]|nr:30S ribosomal protein S8 [Gammaproteobacteria bacterium]
MSMQDPMADMLTSIRNAQTMGIRDVTLPYSRFKTEVLHILKEEGFVEDFQVLNVDNKKDINITLKYYQGHPVIEKIERVSRPALRIYKKCDGLPVVRGGLGIAIVSTPLGVMTDKTARAKRVGGEVLCTVE